MAKFRVAGNFDAPCGYLLEASTPTDAAITWAKEYGLHVRDLPKKVYVEAEEYQTTITLSLQANEGNHG